MFVGHFRPRVLALSIAIPMLVQGTWATSLPESDSLAVKGIISVTGVVQINGQTALPGQTLFGKSNVATFADSESLIALTNLARLNLSANTEITVDSSKTSLSVTLRAGRIVSSAPAGVFVDFTTADLSIKSDATEPVVFSIETTECGASHISVAAGHLLTQRAGHSFTLKAGETFSTKERSAATQPPGQPAFGRKRTIGLLAGIGAAIAVMLAVAMGNNDEDQDNPGDFGGCVIVPSPGAPNTCS